jgi:hypothetical protein
MACRKMFILLDHAIQHLHLRQEITWPDDENAPLDMWNFVRKYRPKQFRIKRADGLYTIRRVHDLGK